MKTDDVVALVKEKGVVKANDLGALATARTLLPYLCKRGVLRRVAPGSYAVAGTPDPFEGFLEVAVAVPHGVFCLLSALQFHELTTQVPDRAWVAIQRGTTRPSIQNLRLRVIQLSEPVFSEGIEVHDAGSYPLRVYSAAKTVVDCFRFRNRVGHDLAREALVEAVDQMKATRDEIWAHARVCRVDKYIRPYLEMVR